MRDYGYVRVLQARIARKELLLTFIDGFIGGLLLFTLIYMGIGVLYMLG